MYAYMYMYMYLYVICISMYISMSSSMSTYMCICMCTCVCIYIYVYINPLVIEALERRVLQAVVICFDFRVSSVLRGFCKAFRGFDQCFFFRALWDFLGTYKTFGGSPFGRQSEPKDLGFRGS